MKTTKHLFPVAICALLMTACGKEGPIGPQGPTGEAGADGTDGAANVTTATATFDEYTGGYTTVDYTLNTGLITQDIIDDGVVLGYLSTSGGWTELNYEIPISGELLLYRGYIDPGQYRVNMKRSDGGVIDAGDPPDSMNPLTVKLVIIQGGRMMDPSDIDRLAKEELAR